MKQFNRSRKAVLVTLVTMMLSITAPMLALALPAINNVTFNANTDFQINTSDTAALTTITVANGGVVTSMDVQSNYIDVTLDNASSVSFSVAAASRYLVVDWQSGSVAYTKSPSCPTTSAALTGTGAQVVLRLSVKTTNTCPSSGGGGGGGGGGVPPPVVVPPTTIPTVSVLNVPTTGIVEKETYLANPTTGANILIPAGTKITNPDGTPFSGNLTYPKTLSEGNLPSALPDGLTYRNAIIISEFAELSFDKEITITIPLPDGTDLATVKIYYYNPDTGEYEIVGDGGTVSADGKSISVKTNHISIFVAADGKSNLVPLLPGQFFTDITDHWAETFINKLHTSCSVNGYVDAAGNPLHLFAPDTQISRAELTKIIAQCKFGDTLTAPTADPFPDVSSSHWAAAAIAKAKEQGWVGGYEDGTFRPDQLVNRAEALKIILLSKFTAAEITGGDVSSFTDIDPEGWYVNYVSFAVMKGFISGYVNADGSPTGLFKPDNNITRAESAKITINALAL